MISTHINKEYVLDKLGKCSVVFSPDWYAAEGKPTVVTRDADTSALDRIAKKNAHAELTILSGLLAIVIHRFAGSTSFIISTPFDSGDKKNTSSLYFHASLDSRLTLRAFIRQMRAEIEETFSRKEYDAQNLAAWLEEKSISSQLLKEICIVHDSLHAENETGDDCMVGFRFSRIEEGKIRIHCSYRDDWQNASAATSITNCLSKLITGFDTQFESTLDALDIIAKEEIALLAQFGEGPPVKEKEQNFVRIFERYALENPSAEAASDEGKIISYGELHRLSDNVAALLINKYHVHPGDIIAFIAVPGIPVLVSIMATVKAGCTYMPVDPAYPEERIALMLKETKANIVLHPAAAPVSVLNYTGYLVAMEELMLAAEEFSTGKITLPGIGYTDIANVIYTSGTTGKPKGSRIPGSGIIRLVRQSDNFDILSSDIFLAATSLAFDISTFYIWGALLNGAKLVFISKEQLLDPDRLSELMKKERITQLFTTPSFFNRLMKLAPDCFITTRKLILGGEALVPYYTRLFVERFGKGRLVNGYGPTENTSFTTSFNIDSVAEGQRTIPIGKPLNGTGCCILDAELRMLPMYAVGELCVWGDGLAKGYIGGKEESEGKFLDHPFIPGKQLYRTGDRCRFLADGTLEYLGRMDKQVKVNGFRIDLVEINSIVAEHSGVSQSYVDAISRNEEKRLVAFIVPAGNPDMEKLKAHLQKRLPSYMMPSEFVWIDAMPETINGKVDTRKLLQIYNSNEGKVRTEMKGTVARLARLWEEVLQVSIIQAGDNFFRIGGTSLSAMSLAAAIHSEFGKKVELNEIFYHPQLEALASIIDKHDKTEEDVIPLLPAANDYEVSFSQRRIWLIDRMQGTSEEFNMIELVRYEQPVDPRILEQALAILIRRHDVLRVSFTEMNSEVRAVMHNEIEFNIVTLDLRGMTDGEAEQKVNEQYIREAHHHFDLSKAPLLRLTHCFNGTKGSVIILNIHHIISDGASLMLFHREMDELYESLVAGKEPQLSNLPVRYVDFAAWQNRNFAKGEFNSSREYWRKQLGGELPYPDLPLDAPVHTSMNHTGSTYWFTIDDVLQKRLQDGAQKHHVSLYMFLLAGFYALLSRVSNQKDLLVMAPLAGRSQKETTNMIGCFINMVVLSAELIPGDSFENLLAQVRSLVLDALSHGHYPFEELLNDLGVRRDIHTFPITPVSFNMPDAEENILKDAEPLNRFDHHNRIVKFHLNCYVFRYKNCIRFQCDYQNELFTEKTIALLFEKYVTLLPLLLEQPGVPLNTVALHTLSPAVHKWKDQSWYSPELSITYVVKQQMKIFSGRCAVNDGRTQISYAQLDQLSDQLAVTILQHTGEYAGIVVSHDFHIMVAILAVLKAGKAYVPLDPEYPEERLKYIIGHAGIQFIITNTEELPLAVSLAGEEIALINMDEQRTEANKNFTLPVVLPGAVAYVLYTSGSTGVPKGVIQTHGGLLHYLSLYTTSVGLTSEDHLSGFSSYCFDASLQEIFGAMLNGACYYPVSLRHLAVDQVAQWISDNQITIWQVVPTLYRLIASVAPVKMLHSLRVIKMAGEASRRDDFYEFLRLTNSKAIFVCSYGASEATYIAANVLTHKHTLRYATLPVGKLVPRMDILLLNDVDTETDALEKGEVFIHSNYITQGYFNAPAYNEKAFRVVNGKRYYKTGDEGRVLSDGSLHLLGRRDYMVKIRGSRVEIQEIELRLLQIANIKQAAVIRKTNASGEAYLAAFVTLNDVSQETNKTIIRKYLAEELPDYMIPDSITVLAQMSLTPSGKTDRVGLESIPETITSDTQDYVTPRNELEKTIASLWKDTLKIERIGIYDGFFESGGHSLHAMQLCSRIYKATGIRIDIGTFLRCGDIASLAAELGPLGETKFERIEKAQDVTVYPATEIQKSFWMTDLAQGGSSANTLRGTFVLSGLSDIDLFREAFCDVIQRHKILRTVFYEQDLMLVQEVLAFDKQYCAVEYTDFLSVPHAWEAASAQMAEGARSEFDLGKGPLIRCRLFRVEEEEYMVGLEIHHIIADHRSVEIIQRDFIAFYENRKANLPIDLPVLPIQYGDYAVWQAGIDQHQIAEHERFWSKQLGPVLPSRLQLPLDFTRPSVKSTAGAVMGISIRPEDSLSFTRFARQNNQSTFSVAFAAISALLFRVTHQDDFLIGTPVSRREHPDLQDQVGPYLNTVLLRSRIQSGQTFNELLLQSREIISDAITHRAYPYNKLSSLLNAAYDPSRFGLFDVGFTWINEQQDGTAGSIESREIESKVKASMADLWFYGAMRGRRLEFHINYDINLFSAETIQLILKRLELLISIVTKDPAIPIEDIDVRLEEEKQLAPDTVDSAFGFDFN
jgi:amino acid adenylation domain-containing protein